MTSDNRLTLREAFERFYPTDELAPVTVKLFYTCLAHWEAFTDNRPIGECTDEDLATFKRGLLGDGIQFETTTDYWHKLRTIFRHLQREGIVETIPQDAPNIQAGRLLVREAAEQRRHKLVAERRQKPEQPELKLVEGGELTFRGGVELYLENAPDLSKRTADKLRHYASCWEKRSDNPCLADIGVADFEDFRKRCRDDGLSPRTIESGIADVLMILRFMYERGAIEAIPSRGRPLRIPHKHPVQPTLAHLGKLYQHADATTAPRRRHVPRIVVWRCFIVLAYCTALRLSDLMAVKWDAVDGNVLSVTAGKTGKLHRIPLHPVCVRHLNLIRRPDHLPIIPLPGHQTRVRQQLRKICEAAGVSPVVTPQQLRRCASTHWERAHAGAGGMIQGSALGGSLAHYIDVPAVLQEAVKGLEVPQEFVDGVELSADELQAIRVFAPERAAVHVVRNSEVNPDDWKFQPGRFAYRGQWFELAGKPLRLLQRFVKQGGPVDVEGMRYLFELNGAPIQLERLRARAKQEVCTLRMKLREALGLSPEVDPLPCVNQENGQGAAWELMFYSPESEQAEDETELFYSEVVA